MKNPILLVVGSMNMDIFTYVENHPKPGETLKSTKVMYCSGGKGANQAVAASLSGGNVYMLGAVGTDPFRESLLLSLKENQVNIDYVLEKETNSGLAFITVDTQGENHIILSEGANGLMEKRDIKEVLLKSITPDAVLLQNEIPWETTKYVMEMANEHNIPVYYNAAPAEKISEEVFPLIHTLIVNEVELSTLTGIEYEKGTNIVLALDQLINYGIEEVIVTLGKEGSHYKNASEKSIFTPAYQVETVDTTAAGDTFVGSFVSKRLLSETIENSLQFATAASAITVTRYGAQVSIPSKIEIEEFLSRKL
ncbi:ribokinase [Neobacillus drentensis]|uniref:ribokinase n=1 Tax=Neobacillus drentensis TaxID=220684 RepID=UPI003000234D